MNLSSPFFLPVCCGLGGDVTSFVFLIYVCASEFLGQIFTAIFVSMAIYMEISILG